MSVPLFDLLTREWLVAIFLIAAISFLTLRFRRGSFFSPSRTSLYWGAIFILLAVGSLLSTLFKPTQLEKLPWVLGSLGLGLMLSCLLLWFAGRWSFWNGLAIGGLLCLTLGAWAVPSLQASGASFVGSIPSLELVEPIYLILLLFVPLIIVLSLHSLAGLGPIRRWVALGLRCFLIIALVLALAEPRLKRPSENVAVCFVIDRSLSVPQEIDQTTSDSPGGPVDFRWRRIQTFINDAVTRRGNAHRNDQTGVIFFARRPQLVMPASAVDRMYVSDSLASTMDPNYTDIAASIKLAMASFPEGVGKRIVLISDGNENLGNAEQQAYLAKQNGIQIDTLPLAVGYRNENEVLVQAVEAPPQIATGARLPIRVLIRNAHPTRIVRGRLELLQSRDGNEKPVPIQASQDVLDASRSPALVRLRPGLNVFSFRDRAETAKKEEEFSFTYRAVFQPLEAADPDGGNRVEGLPGDRIQNNRALTQVIARGQRRVLFIEQDTADGSHQFLIEQMRAAKFKVFPVNAARLPQNRNDLSVFLSNYDCLVICDVPAEMLREQQEGIRSNTYDQGCGLVMIGGPDSFGAGGYHKTAIEQALPVDCDIKAMKAAGKGGLVLIMHASEMADGNKWQKDIAKLAIERLNAIDMVGVMQYGGINPIWHIPFQTVGDDRGKLLGAIDRMTPGPKASRWSPRRRRGRACRRS